MIADCVKLGEKPLTTLVLNNRPHTVWLFRAKYQTGYRQSSGGDGRCFWFL